MSNKAAFALVVSLTVALSATSFSDTPKENVPEVTERDAPLKSILRRAHDVFASNDFGLFHAKLHDAGNWERLELLKDMPFGGRFASGPQDSELILYIASNYYASGDGKKGLYISYDSGASWNLQSEREDYGPVLLLPDGSLFAVTNPHGSCGVFKSEDLGKRWRDITGGSFGTIHDIFPDPDHEGQVCLRANSIRGYILQADDERYAWKATREWDWHPERFMTTEFFKPDYSASTTLYMLGATLNNYFQFDFGSRSRIPAIELLPDKSRITVRLGEPVRVPFTIRFLEDMHLNHWYWNKSFTKGETSPQPEPRKIILVDTTSQVANGPWGIRVGFNDKRIFTQPKTTSELKEVSLTAATPYHRELDLGELHDFSKPGTYKVQLTYYSSKLAEHQKGHWGGSLRSPVFEIEVTP